MFPIAIVYFNRLVHYIGNPKKNEKKRIKNKKRRTERRKEEKGSIPFH